MGLNWDFLQLPSADTPHLDDTFSLTELKDAISICMLRRLRARMDLLGLFNKTRGDIVCSDLLTAQDQMHELRGDHWHLLNTANNFSFQKKDAVSSPLASSL